MPLHDATVTQCVVQVDDLVTGPRMFDGRPSLWWLLREFIRFGVTDFLLLTDRMPADIEDSLPCRVGITLSPPPPDSGSGGALFHARHQLRDRFLLCDGRTLFDWNLSNLLAAAALDKSGSIGRIVRFDRLISSGIALFRKDLVDHLRPVCSLEADVLPELARRDMLRVTFADSSGIPAGLPLSWPNLAGSPGTLPRFALQIAGGRTGVGQDMEDQSATGNAGLTTAGYNPLRRKALFLDRDGVLNIDHGYVGSRDRFEWVDGALDAIRHATEAGWHVFIVTNQSGVARGHYTEDAVHDLLNWLAEQARAAGGTVDDVRFCPFHPDAALDAYRQAHRWRKPLPGMLLDLIRTWELAPDRAVMVGDQETDMQAAAAAGVTGHSFAGGNLLAFLKPILGQKQKL